MEVKDVIKEKQKLEQVILRLLDDFEEKTGVYVRRVELEKMILTEFEQIDSVRLEVVVK